MSEQVFLCDSIIEQGEKNGWKYRKWASGKKECWLTKTFTISGSWSFWGNQYYKRLEAVGNYPFTFNSKPSLQVSISPQGSDMWLYVRGSTNYNTTEHPCEVALLRASNLTTSCNVDVNFYAVGE